jgi:hypothetical protein
MGPMATTGSGSGPFSGWSSWGRRDLRVSDAERNAVIDSLRQHAGEGRLTVDELSQRIDQAYNAKTVGQLDAVQSDLPRPPVGALIAPGVSPVVIRRRRKRGWAFWVARLALIDVTLVVIWAVSGHNTHDFWPIWPIAVSLLFMAWRGLRIYERSRARSS